MRRIALVTSVLLAMGVAQAGPMTLPDTVGDTANFGTDGNYFLATGASPSHNSTSYRYFYQDWDWDHSVTYLGDPSPDASGVRTLESATLTVYAWQADETDQIIADGTLLGNLVKPPVGLPDTWTTTTFNLSAILASLEDGMLDVDINIDTGEDWFGRDCGLVTAQCHLQVGLVRAGSASATSATAAGCSGSGRDRSGCHWHQSDRLAQET